MNSVAEAVFSHNLWANLRLIDFCERLEGMPLDAIARGTFGSIRDTLTHIVGAEEWYVDLLSDQKPEQPLADVFPGFEVLRDHAQWSGMALIQIATDMPVDLVRHDVQAPGPDSFHAVAVLIQAVNHGTEHRSQVKTILSQHGIEPPHIDGWVYAAANGMLGGWKIPYITHTAVR
jgi:uncharacterized damage-inducible protein DinB